MRLDEIQATFLNIKLPYLKDWSQERNAIAEMYNTFLSGTGDIILPETAKDSTSVFHLYVIRTSQRNALQNYLSGQGIGTLIHYPIPPHLQEAYKYLGYRRGDFPIAEELADTSLSLPMYIGLTEHVAEKGAGTIEDFFNQPQ